MDYCKNDIEKICRARRRQSKGSNMKIQFIKSRPQLMWITTAVVVAFYSVDIGIFMGWIPASYGNQSNNSYTTTAAYQDIRPQVARENVVGNSSETAMCYECGVIVLIREIHNDSAASDIGMISGNLLGNEIDKKTGSIKNYEIKIRFDDGSSRMYSAGKPPVLRSGNQVKVVDGVIKLNPYRARDGVRHHSRRSAVAAASVEQLFGNEGMFRRAMVNSTA